MLTIDQLPPTTGLSYADQVATRDVSETVDRMFTKRATIRELMNMWPGGRAVPVEEYGAVGDGTTNDAAAVLAAMTAAGAYGTVVFQPGKTYKITGQVAVPVDGLNIVGYGATIVGDNEADYRKLLFSGRARGNVRGIRFNGLYSLGVIGAIGAGSVEIVASSDILIEDCEFNLVLQGGVYIKGDSRRCIVRNNSFHRNFCAIFADDDTITVKQPTRLRICGNVIREGLGATTTALSGAIKISGVPESVYHIIEENIIDAPGQMGIEVQGPDNYLISNNSITGAYMGVSVSDSNWATIDGNAIKGCEYTGVEVASSSADCLVANNGIDNTALYGITVVSNSVRVTISGNRVSATASECIYIQSGPVSVCGNIISGKGNVYVHNASSVAVVGNIFVATSGAAFSALFIDGTDTSLSGISFVSNRVTGAYSNSVVKLYVASGANTISDVLVTDNNTKGCTAGLGFSTTVPNIGTNLLRIRSFDNIGNGNTSFENLNIEFWATASNLAWPYDYMFFERGMISVDASGGVRTHSLPSPATVGPGYIQSVRKSDGSGNAVNVTTPSGSINGTASLTAQNKVVTYKSDGANYFVISES